MEFVFSSGEEEEDYFNSDEECSGDINDDVAVDDLAPAASSWTGSSCEVITKESLLAAQMDDLRRVIDLLSVGEHHARTLLIHYRWDVDKLLAVLVEKGQAYLFAEAGVHVVEQHDLSSLSPASSLQVHCDVCMEDFSRDKITQMECGHSFCNNCWTEHFVVKITEGKSKQVRCMAHKCNAICDEAIIRTLVKERHPELVQKFDRFLLESYIEDNKKVKWCPSTPHCGNAIRNDSDELCEVECTCGLQFCFSCVSEPHSPCSCLIWEMWSQKCRDESETVKWITVNTKNCPTCHNPVEKNGGCNIVRCRCGSPFCWLCLQAKSYNHSCGRYVEDPEKQVEYTRKYLDRYIHYYNRYKAHKDSLKLEGELDKKIREKIASVEATEANLQDFSWLKNGLGRLFRCRRILSYSYAFAFYMFGEELFKDDEMTKEERVIKQNLFEDQQQQLEGNVEMLSKLIDEPFADYDMDKVTRMRMQVMDLSRVTNQLCMNMYDCIENDLLGSLRLSTHNIAPYKSEGVERAAKLSVHWRSDADDYYYDHSAAELTRGKRARLGDAGDEQLIDLNQPPEAADT